MDTVDPARSESSTQLQTIPERRREARVTGGVMNS